MNSEMTNSRYIPEMAIIVYKNGREYSPDYYLETREIKKVGSKFSFMAPVPLANETMKKIAMNYAKSNSFDMTFSGIIPGNILFASNKSAITTVMWFAPAMKRCLNFSASLPIKNATDVFVPPLLFVTIDKKLYIYALMNDERPGLKTKIYNAPFFNIYEDGNVCLGTALVGSKTHSYEKEAERFERAFFMAEQNGGISAVCKTPLTRLWNKLMKNNASFPCKKELIQNSKYKTVGDLIDKLIGKNSYYEEED